MTVGPRRSGPVTPIAADRLDREDGIDQLAHVSIVGFERCGSSAPDVLDVSEDAAGRVALATSIRPHDDLVVEARR